MAELSQQIEVVEDGKRHRLTKQQAMIKSLTSAAVNNNTRALTVLLACLKLFGPAADEANLDTIEFEDLEILQHYIERERKTSIKESD